MKKNLKLKSYRKEKRLSQTKMAEKIGIDRTSYTLKENGDRKFTLEEAKIISDILGVSIEELFFREE